MRFAPKTIETSLLAVGATILTLVLASCTAMPERGNVRDTPVPLAATTVCQAGCNGSKAGCQRAGDPAVFTASEGRSLFAYSLALIKVEDKSDGPGLSETPEWVMQYFPTGTSRPTRMILTLDPKTCIGRSGDKTGITTYTFQVLQGLP